MFQMIDVELIDSPNHETFVHWMYEVTKHAEFNACRRMNLTVDCMNRGHFFNSPDQLGEACTVHAMFNYDVRYNRRY